MLRCLKQALRRGLQAGRGQGLHGGLAGQQQLQRKLLHPADPPASLAGPPGGPRRPPLLRRDLAEALEPALQMAPKNLQRFQTCHLDPRCRLAETAKAESRLMPLTKGARVAARSGAGLPSGRKEARLRPPRVLLQKLMGHLHQLMSASIPRTKAGRTGAKACQMLQESLEVETQKQKWSRPKGGPGLPPGPLQGAPWTEQLLVLHLCSRLC